MRNVRLVRGYLYSGRFPIIGGTSERTDERTRVAAASTPMGRRGYSGWRGTCVIGVHLWARMSCRSLLSLASRFLFRASPSTGSTTPPPPPPRSASRDFLSLCLVLRLTWKHPPRIFYTRKGAWRVARVDPHVLHERRSRSAAMSAIAHRD